MAANRQQHRRSFDCNSLSVLGHHNSSLPAVELLQTHKKIRNSKSSSIGAGIGRTANGAAGKGRNGMERKEEEEKDGEEKMEKDGEEERRQKRMMAVPPLAPPMEEMPSSAAMANALGPDSSSFVQLTENGHPVSPVPAPRQIYKVVLTGGPCGGKTTGQERMATFFEGLGWKVFTVPEAASVLLNGRVRFVELSAEQAYQFQKDLILTLLQMEKVFFNQAEMIRDRNVLVICDRGALDPSAYMPRADWDRLLREAQLDTFDLRDSRYNQIVHMVTAADGAQEYYSCQNNAARFEKSIDQALDQDRRTREAWVGHQCLSIVDNAECRNFNDKVLKLIKVVCERLGISFAERLAKNSKKRKWLVVGLDEAAFKANKFEEFGVLHTYLSIAGSNQVRLRKRWQKGRASYTLTTRRYEAPDGTKLPEPVETRKQLTSREYVEYVTMRDQSRFSVHKKRRCFVYGNVYFQLDIFVEPLPPACNGDGRPLMILETYTTRPVGDSEPKLPSFLTVQREITGELAFSMFNLASPKPPSSFAA